MRKLLLLILLGAALSGAARADALDFIRGGMAAQKRGDWDMALGLFNQALASGELSDKGKAQVMGLVANAYGAKGLYDKAVAEFTEVIQFRPQDPAPLVGRSIVYRQLGKYDLAIADAGAAVKLDSGFIFGYTNRGLAEFYAGKFAEAAQDFTKTQTAIPTEPDFALWVHLAHARAGQNDATELARNATKLDLKTWSGAAVAFYLGKIDAAALREAAKDANAVVANQQRCEAAFYLGEDALLRGQKDQAMGFFQEVLDACAVYKTNYVYFSNDYGAAKEELARLAR